MKKYFFILVCGLCLSFAPRQEVNTTAQANVEKTDGLFLFIMSKPAEKYETLGTIKTPAVVWNDKLKTTIKVAVKQCKKQYPSATGVIFTSQYDWQAIKAVK